ncbi:MAG: hypothetical protein BIFFINMI_01406 [Phycisphaerae bacterium]|nr:hypothetical protein [Phycisphaerae bacterium]
MPRGGMPLNAKWIARYAAVAAVCLAGAGALWAQPAPTSRPDDLADVPAGARDLLNLIRRMGDERMPDPRDSQAFTAYDYRLKEAAKALGSLRERFPEVAARADVRRAELEILFESAQIRGDVEMQALRGAVAGVLADATASRELKAHAEYHLLNADLRKKAVTEPAASPDKTPAWLEPELDRRLEFARKYKDLDIGREAYGEGVLLKVQLNGYPKSLKLVDEFIAAYPKQPDAAAVLLGRIAVDEYSRHRDGWDRAWPVLQRMLAEYPEQEVTRQVVGPLVLRRLLSAPAEGTKLMADLTKDYPGNEAVATVWAQLARDAFEKEDAKLLADRLNLLATTFKTCDARADLLANLALESYRAKGMDAATPYVKALQSDFPKNAALPALMTQLALREVHKVGYPKARDFVQQVVKDYGQDESTARLKGLVRRHDAAGKPFDLAEWKFKAVDGREVDPTQWRGQVVVLLFWASWSTRSTADMTKLIALEDRFKDHNVRWVGISLDASRRQLDDYLAEVKLPWPNRFEPEGPESKQAVAWGIGATDLPLALVIARDGRLVNAGVQESDELKGLLTALAAEPAPKP